MLIVETIAKIRRLSLVQGKSIKAICRELKISRKVVRKVLRSDETEFRYERKHQPYPRMGAWREKLDLLLRIKFSGLLTQDEIKDLCYAAGISTHHLGDETAAQKLFRQRRELREVHLRG